MTSLIINMPHLQSRRQRHGAMLLSILCWAWFIMPLVIVASWMMGFHVFAQEIVWLGGWRSLVHLAEIAVTIIAALTAAWGLWTLLEMRASHAPPVDAPVLQPGDTATAFGVEPGAIAAAVSARVTTVHFTKDGAIAAIMPDIDHGHVPQPTRLRQWGHRTAVA
jgi:poly-beta-1,6-N-acetyl-D-glucosamine biosynthesis protein PgaD